MEKLIRDIIEESACRFAELTAVKWLKKKEIFEINYASLHENITAIRKALLKEGFLKKHIALIGTSSVEWIESYLGIITGGCVAVPLDAGLPDKDLTDLINRSDSEALFLSPKNLSLLSSILADCPKLKNIWILNGDNNDTEKNSILNKISAFANNSINNSNTVSFVSDLKNVVRTSDNDADRPAPDDTATIIFTSGTTGKSKGVMLTHNNLASNVQSVNYYTESGTVMLSVLPVHHVYCLVMDWLKGFSLGATVCINDSLMHMMRNMGVFKPEVILMVPMMVETIYKRLAAADPSIPKNILANKIFGGNLRIIFMGGAHLDPFYIDKFAEYGIDIYEGYGMSECSPVISSNLPGCHKTGSIGRPLSNAEISFDNGEILVRGTSVMKGYYNMPKETAETLRDGWLHTGDKGYIDEDGFLFINGRVKNLIILSNGENISPEEIENKLALDELVGEVIVTGEKNGLTARIYPEQELVIAANMTEDEVRKNLQAFIDQYNSGQPTYRRITGLVIRKNPFIRSSTKKIKRQEALIDEPMI